MLQEQNFNSTKFFTPCVTCLHQMFMYLDYDLIPTILQNI